MCEESLENKILPLVFSSFDSKRDMTQCMGPVGRWGADCERIHASGVNKVNLAKEAEIYEKLNSVLQASEQKEEEPKTKVNVTRLS